MESSSYSYVLHFTGPPESDVDDLGFENPWRPPKGRPAAEPSEVDKQNLEVARKDYILFWKSYLHVLVRRRRRWEQMDPRRNTSVLQRFIHKGIPSNMRKEIWLRNCPPRSVAPSSPVPNDVIEAIQLDLPRTFPDNVFLRSPQSRNRLGRVLYSLAQHIPSIGYCQGLNFLAGLCLMVINQEDKAADLLVHVVSPRADYYNQSMCGLQRDMRVLEELLRYKLPSVHRCLKALDIGLDILVGKWFLCMFIDSLPMESVLRVWDCVIYEGDAWLFRIAVRLLRGNAKRLAACTTMDQLLTVVRSIGSTNHAMECHALIKAAKDEKITGQEIDKLRQQLAA